MTEKLSPICGDTATWVKPEMHCSCSPTHDEPEFDNV